MPTLDEQLQRAIPNIQQQVAPAFGADIVEVWRDPDAPTPGGSNRSPSGNRIGTSGSPSSAATKVHAYYSRLGADSGGHEADFGGQPVAVGQYIFTFNAADAIDIQSDDLLMVAAKREILLDIADLGWQPSTAYALGAHEQPSVSNQRWYLATNGGVSGSSEPAFPTVKGETVMDGTVEWTCMGLLDRYSVIDPGGNETIQVERVVIAQVTHQGAVQ